jgi:hypothetical protein
VVARFYVDSEGRNNPIQFAEIFEKMVSQLLHDFELLILLRACCEFKLICMIWFLNVILVL